VHATIGAVRADFVEMIGNVLQVEHDSESEIGDFKFQITTVQLTNKLRYITD
jgi:hypothetical protein